jgi:GDP-4-dehydro-6-deoxy-D-mannose reductase
MRILVAGAGGFAGRHLLAHLRERFGAGAVVLGLDGSSLPGDAMPSKAANRVSADLRDPAAIAAVVRDFVPQVTVNLAAISSVAEARADSATTYDVNVAGALTLARCVAATSPRSLFIQASTADIYGRAFLGGLPVDEATCVSPQNPYARSKLAAECALQDVVSDALRVVALRLSNHIGPGQDERFAAASFAAQIARIEAGRAPPILKTGDLTAERDFLDVADAMRAYLAVITAERSQMGFTIYNVASGVSRSLQSVLDGLMLQTSASIRVEQDASRLRPNDIPVARLATAAFHAATGWSPKTPFADTLRSILTSWRDKVAEEETR